MVARESHFLLVQIQYTQEETGNFVYHKSVLFITPTCRWILFLVLPSYHREAGDGAHASPGNEIV